MGYSKRELSTINMLHSLKNLSYYLLSSSPQRPLSSVPTLLLSGEVRLYAIKL